MPKAAVKAHRTYEYVIIPGLRMEARFICRRFQQSAAGTEIRHSVASTGQSFIARQRPTAVMLQ